MALFELKQLKKARIKSFHSVFATYKRINSPKMWPVHPVCRYIILYAWWYLICSLKIKFQIKLKLLYEKGYLLALLFIWFIFVKIILHKLIQIWYESSTIRFSWYQWYPVSLFIYYGCNENPSITAIVYRYVKLITLLIIVMASICNRL